MHGHGERTTGGSGRERSSSAASCERARRQRRMPVGQASGPFLQRLDYANRRSVSFERQRGTSAQPVLDLGDCDEP
jgi:predicted ATPase with chaperone activity